MIPQISIRQSFGQIGLSRQLMDWQITSKPADLSIHSESPQIEITREPGKLTIDQSEAFNEEGLMGPLTLIKDSVAQAQQAAETGTEETAQFGDQFAHIEKRGSPFTDWVNRYANQHEDYEIALAPGPFSVHIQYEPSHLDIQIQPGVVINQTEVHTPQVSFTAGNVKAFIERYQSISISAPWPVGQNLNKQV